MSTWRRPPVIRLFLGDIVGSVPNQCNKRSHLNFWLSRAYKSYVYTILWSIKCVITYVFKKINVHALMENIKQKITIITSKITDRRSAKQIQY